MRQMGVRPHTGSGSDYGDFYVHFKVTIPKSVSKEQRELLEQFEKLEKEHPQTVCAH